MKTAAELRAENDALFDRIKSQFDDILGTIKSQTDAVRDAIGHLPPQERIVKEEA